MAHERIIYGLPEKRGKPVGSRKNLRRALVFFAAILALAGGIYVVHLPQWRVADIEVTGTETLNPAEIKDALGQQIGGYFFWIIPKNSMFLIRTEALGAKLAVRFPRAASIVVAKKFPNMLAVEVRERRLWGIFCNDLSYSEGAATSTQALACAYLDQSGFAYEYAPRSSGTLILKIRSDGAAPEIGKSIIDSAYAGRMRVLAKELWSRVEIGTVGFQLYANLPHEIRVVTAEGFTIYFNREDDFDNPFRVLRTLLEDEIKSNLRPRLEYIDLRFGNKVFYKLRQ